MFLDDDENRFAQLAAPLNIPNVQLTWVTSVAAFQSTLHNSENKFDVVMLDHDLGDDEKHGTGLDAAKILKLITVDTLKDLPVIIIHSMNPIGAANMVFELRTTVYVVHVIPGAWAKAYWDNGLCFKPLS